MKEAKFTKGPWVEYLGASNIVEVHNGDGLEVVNWQGFDGNGNFSNQTVEANAYLIATAPEMYSELNELSGIIRRMGAESASDRIDQLLAKARGEA